VEPAATQNHEPRIRQCGEPVKLPSPFALKIFHAAGCGRRQGSSMNSLRSALTAVLAGSPDPEIRAKGDYEGGLPPSIQLAKSVYHVLGTKCIPCIGLDKGGCSQDWLPHYLIMP
jgi:hypothetical protein